MRTLQGIGRVALVFVAGALTAASVGAGESKWPSTKGDAPSPKVKGMPAVLQKNLATFDDLDFRVYTGQKWEDLHKSHSKDIVVHWPDGHTTKGIDKHIEDLKVMFSFAPDNRIVEHPVRFGSADGEWTGVSGWLEGTFSKPMALPDGSSIPPTGKAYRIPMATLGHWNKDGVMFEEHLFWDNGEFMKQIGLAK